MRLPICYFCARTKMLCPRDSERLNRGEISQLDVEISHALVLLKEDKYPELDKLALKKAIQKHNITVLLIENGPITRSPVLRRVERDLEAMGFGKVRFVVETSDARKLVEQLLAPCRVIGVNVLWLPDGSSEYSVRIAKRDLRRVPLKLEDVKAVLEVLLGKPVRMVVE